MGGPKEADCWSSSSRAQLLHSASGEPHEQWVGPGARAGHRVIRRAAGLPEAQVVVSVELPREQAATCHGCSWPRVREDKDVSQAEMQAQREVQAQREET